MSKAFNKCPKCGHVVSEGEIKEEVSQHSRTESFIERLNKAVSDVVGEPVDFVFCWTKADILKIMKESEFKAINYEAFVDELNYLEVTPTTSEDLSDAMIYSKHIKELPTE